VRTDYLKDAKSILGGKVKTYYVPVERSLDIDTPYDWEIAEFLMDKRSRG
jgi:N-acylneuraminate cytidylyltransferase